ncbi:hypothetical protein [Streptomyces sp. NBC_00365]|uniref:ATP-dependent DNA ligase n=1 Tax=Streptomyces sp. NBC_00365 TaxID=2975726 RepID=UPI002B1E306A|nr:hypothetical protein [Streptomyces sp. NBC_00365]
MTAPAPAFPDIAAAAVHLPDATALDGELVVWGDDRLAFERLQNRLQRRGTAAARAADECPAHFVAFDLLRLSGTDTSRPAGGPGGRVPRPPAGRRLPSTSRRWPRVPRPGGIRPARSAGRGPLGR